MKKAFKKFVSQKIKTERDALQALQGQASATGPTVASPDVTAATWNASSDVLSTSGATGLNLLANEERAVPSIADSAPGLYQGMGHNSRQSDDSQFSYSASESSSGRDDEDEFLAEPLEEHPRYRRLQDLNRGTSGFVQLAENVETGEVVAIKFLERGGSASQRVIARELLNHRECALHPNIVQLKEVFLTPHHLGIALEYADGGDLSEFIDERAQRGVCSRGWTPMCCCRMHRDPVMTQLALEPQLADIAPVYGGKEIYGCSEKKARWFFQQFIIGLDYCHRLGIANRDIKLDNVLLHGRGERPVVKICDFGYSKDEEAGSICKTACGTPEYMAPEVLTTGLYEGKVADIWSCGVLLYVLLEGSFPFVRKGDEDEKGARALQIMFGRVMKADFEMPPQVSSECKDLLQKMLTTDPLSRLSIQGIMEHPWFLTDLPAGALEVNSRLKLMDNVRFGQCKQTAAQIMHLVNECNAVEERQEAAFRGDSPELDAPAATPGASKDAP